MARPASPTTSVSTRDRSILPKAIRKRRDRDAGTRLIVEETLEGAPKTLDEMHAAVLAEARRRHGRD